MIELRTLGTLELRDAEEDRTVASVLARPKRVALLVYLSLARPQGPQRRDTLLPVFWPERSEERARHALNQALYVLRRGLGSDAVRSGADDVVEVDPTRVWCDARAFEASLDEGRPEAALDLYLGELLAGFHVEDAGGFERWLELERRRLADRAIAAARTLARERAEDGNPVGAVRWLRRAAEWAPYDEDLHRELVHRLAATGDRAGALRHHDRFVERLRDELGLEPASGLVRLAEGIRAGDVGVTRPRTGVAIGGRAGHGDPEAPVAVPASGKVVDDGRRTPRNVAEPTEDAKEGRSVVPRLEWLGGTLVVLLILITVGLLAGPGPAAESDDGPRIAGDPAPGRVAVLPFRFRGAEEYAYLGDGMAELLSTRLDGVGPLRSVDPGAVIDRARASDRSYGDPSAARSVAGRFGADLFVTGSVLEVGDRLSLHAALYDASGDVEARASGTGVADSLFNLVDRLAQGLIADRYSDGGERRTGIAAATTRSLPALQAYLEGKQRVQDGNYQEAVRAFERAVALDTAFALGWYGLARAADWTPVPGRSSEAAEQALRHVERLPIRERRLLEAWQAYTDVEVQKAERLYREILDTYPEEVEAWYQLGEVLFHFGWRRGHPISEPRAAFERVLELQPTHDEARIHLARIAVREGRAPEVLQLTSPLIDPATSPLIEIEALLLRGLSAGDSVALDRGLEALARRDPDELSSPLWSIFYVRDVDTAERFARLLVEADRPALARARGLFVLATVEMARGRLEGARRALDRAAQAGPSGAVDWSTGMNALFRTLPHLPATREALEKTRIDLESWRPGRSRLGEAFGTYADVHRDVRQYLLGLTEARLERPAEARRRAEAIVSRAEPAGVRTLSSRFARSLRAAAWHAEGETDRALDALGDTWPTTYETEALWPYYEREREWYVRARLLEEAGRPLEALDAYASVGGTLHGLPYVAPAQFRQGRIREARGESEIALAHYRSFVRLWADAAPGLRARVEEARERIRRLSSADR